MLAISDRGAPGTHGAGVTGVQVPGVSTPSAAAVWAAVIGLARLVHSPNGMMFMNGLLSMMLAAGWFSTITRLAGSTINVDGAIPNEHKVDAPLTTCGGIAATLVGRTRPVGAGARSSVPDVSDTDPACPFCAIVEGAGEAHVVLDDGACIAFLDRTPLFAGHVLVVPRRHVVTLPDLAPEEVGPLFACVQRIAAVLPDALGAQGTFVALNNVVSQSVAHLHVHVVPRTKGDGLRGFFWPRTRYGEGQAEAVAAVLRAALEP